MHKALITLLLLFVFSCVEAKECVVLLHGLARSDGSMSVLAEQLSSAGYLVINQPYASRSKKIEELSLTTLPTAIASCGQSPSVHFVSHSMGGILIRYYLSKNTIQNLGRVVMLGPPNKGSEVVDKLGSFPGFQFINGPAGMQLGTGSASVPNTIGPVDFNLGIIAGTKSINFILSTQIPGTDDGKVSVENTKIEGMNDHIIMPVTHTFMMRNSDVIHQVLHYLDYGYFLTPTQPNEIPALGANHEAQN